MSINRTTQGGGSRISSRPVWVPNKRNGSCSMLTSRCEVRWTRLRPYLPLPRPVLQVIYSRKHNPALCYYSMRIWQRAPPELAAPIATLRGGTGGRCAQYVVNPPQSVENIHYPVRSLRNKLQTASEVEVASDLKPSNLGGNDFSNESVPQNEHN